MSNNEFRHRLLTDLRRLGLPVDEVSIYLRPFSKTFYGRYFPSYDGGFPKIYIYPYEEDGSFMSYRKILETAVHEFCHHIQYSTGHKRVKGVMHDSQFWNLYNQYTYNIKDENGGDVVETKAV